MTTRTGDHLSDAAKLSKTWGPPLYYRWRKEYGGLRLDQAKRLKALEQENTRLKRLVADQALDNAILKEVASGNF